MNFKISALYSYPIKSLGGISLSTAQLTKTGLPYDRFWMLVDTDGKFITQRALPQMSLFELSFSETGIVVKYDDDQIEIPFDLVHQESRNLSTIIWKDQVLAQKENDQINDWFSKKLEKPVFLVRRAKAEKRFVGNHAPTEINFPDDGQILVIGHAALDNLNQKLDTPIAMNRFRPNIVFQGGTPHLEDTWTALTIKNSAFESTKSCARCQMITINQETAAVGVEPIKTLSTYRLIDKKIWFGRLIKLTTAVTEQISVGDDILVTRTVL